LALAAAAAAAQQACYMRLPPSARRACDAAGIPFREAVHAASHVLLNVLPLYMVCNSTDMGTECDNPYDTRFRPERLLLYDKHPGGIGLAAQVRAAAVLTHWQAICG
jgi:DEAD/DEAH box helicase domain-containing protein